MKTPIVSVIVPSFNSAKYIRQMVDSLLEQTLKDWELLIVDDNSDDDTCKIISEYSKYDSRINLIVKSLSDLKGANCSRNIGLMKSSGEYVVFFDSDDIISPNCLENRVNHLSNLHDIDFCVFPAISFKKKPFDDIQVFGYVHYSKCIGKFIQGTLPFTVWTNIYKRSSLIDNDIYWDEHLKSWQDRDYNLTAIHKGLRYTLQDSSPDYFWRIEGNANSISKKILSVGHFTSRVYFLNKWDQKLRNKYNPSLLVLSYEIFISALDFSNDTFDHFVSSDFFKNKKRLRFKLSILYRFINKYRIRNKYIRLLFGVLMCPLYTIRPYLHFRYYIYFQQKAYKELFYKYYNSCMSCFIN